LFLGGVNSTERAPKGVERNSWFPILVELFARGGATMDLMSILVFLIIGAIAGWLAGLIVRGGGFGLIGDILVGVIGAFVAGAIFPRIGVNLGGGVLGAILGATVGAVILLLIVRVVRRA
jgi:uncharacterized membrane protein YeaQ/YmgE (transglycosylase-associated protein family)